MAGHETVRSTDLSALQGIFFEELDNLMALDINADDEAIEREINRAKQSPMWAHAPSRTRTPPWASSAHAPRWPARSSRASPRC